jgi:HD-like signal output (HDOD) protein
MIVGTSAPFKGAYSPEDVACDFRLRASAPRVLPRLKELLSDGNSSTHEIVTFIRLDAGIVARVLQVANSVYFSKGVRCSTIEEAVGRVGFNQVYELVSYAAASDVLAQPLHVYDIDANELWRRSVSCAISAELIAGYIGMDRDLAYTIALLHCVGMVAIDDWAERAEKPFAFASAGYPRDASEAERIALGFTNAEAGAAVLRQWDFPAEITEPVRWQYAPRSGGANTGMAWLLFAAKWVRSTVCARTAGERPAPLDAAHIKAAGLRPGVLGGCVEEVRRRLRDVDSMLETNPGKQRGGAAAS